MHETRRGDGLEASSARVVLGLRKGSRAGVLGAGVGGPPSPWGTSWSPECPNVERPAVHFRDRPTEFTCAHMHLHAAHPCTCADTVHTGTWTQCTHCIHPHEVCPLGTHRALCAWCQSLASVGLALCASGTLRQRDSKKGGGAATCSRERTSA